MFPSVVAYKPLRVMILAVVTVGPVLANHLPCVQPEDVGLSGDRLAHLDSFYGDKVTKGEMAGIVVLIARHGKIAHFSAIDRKSVV